MRVAPKVTVTDEQRATLRRWSRGRTTPARLVRRAQIVLRAAQGKANLEIAAELGVERTIVGRWRRRFAEEGLSGIEKDAPRGGRKPTVRNRVGPKIIEYTTQRRPRNATHWSTNRLAKELGVSQSMVSRVWRAHGLKPHLSRTFKVSNDPQFVEKLIDVAGLYLNPPEHALVLCVDEKSQTQALDRTQPLLPWRPGSPARQTHDYKRQGTTTLFAALNLLDGKVIGECLPRHRSQEFVRFLKKIDQETPADLDLHLIVDHYSTHKSPVVKRWLARHKRFHMHFVPTGSSWLNMVERWFGEITRKRIRRGTFKSVRQLIDAITNDLERYSGDPIPFVWTKDADMIIAKVNRCKEKEALGAEP